MCQHPTEDAIELAFLSAAEMRKRIVQEIQRSARGVDAGVSQPDLWALSNYIEKSMT